MPFCFSMKMMPSCHTLSNALKIAIHLMFYGIFFIQTLRFLPSTSNMSHGHSIRSHYVIFICSNLISARYTNFSPVKFGWNSVDSVLMSNKYIVTL